MDTTVEDVEQGAWDLAALVGKWRMKQAEKKTEEAAAEAKKAEERRAQELEAFKARVAEELPEAFREALGLVYDMTPDRPASDHSAAKEGAPFATFVYGDGLFRITYNHPHHMRIEWPGSHNGSMYTEQEYHETARRAIVRACAEWDNEQEARAEAAKDAVIDEEGEELAVPTAGVPGIIYDGKGYALAYQLSAEIGYYGLSSVVAEFQNQREVTLVISGMETTEDEVRPVIQRAKITLEDARKLVRAADHYIALQAVRAKKGDY